MSINSVNNDSLYYAKAQSDSTNTATQNSANKKGPSVIITWSDVKIIDPWDKDIKYKGQSYDLKNPSEYDKMVKKGEVAIVDKFVPQRSGKKPLSIFHRTKNMDYKIGKTKQGFTNDCSLLSTINSLTYTEEGQKLIKEMINYDENGAYVTFKGVDKTVYVPYRKVHRAKFRFRYSAGDDDMKVIELAMNKVLSETKKGNFGDDIQMIGSGKLISYPENCLHYLMGNECKEISCKQDKLPNDADAIVYSFGTSDYQNDMKFSWQTLRKIRRDLKDAITGKKISLYAQHAYAIKNIDKENGVVELVNPWNNSKSVHVHISDIDKGYFEYCKFKEQ